MFLCKLGGTHERYLYPPEFSRAVKTPPVEEFIKEGRNGLLVDFLSPRQIANRIDEVLNHPDRMRYLGQEARRDIIEHYDVNKQLVKYQKLITPLLKQK